MKLLDSLIALPLALTLLLLSSYLLSTTNKTMRLLEAYYFIHENSYLAEFFLRKELKITKQPTFFIANTSRKNKQGHDIYSLYQKQKNENAVEIIEGVEKIIISPKNKKCLDVFLLLTSKHDVLNSPIIYSFSGKKIKAQDKRLYQPIHFVIAAP